MRAPMVLVGAGGIGAPAAWALAEAGARELLVIDDDVVERSNLHRQILFEDEDVGKSKGACFAHRLRQRHADLEVEIIEGRVLPGSAVELVSGAAVVIDATDNFASRFLIADAAHLAGVGVVHAAAVRWHATVMAVRPAGRPCYRCLFEDLPSGQVPDCATAGVLGPLCGVAGAVAADRALRLVAGDRTVTEAIVTYDARRDRLREVRVGARADCPLCGTSPGISTIEASRYMTQPCEAW